MHVYEVHLKSSFINVQPLIKNAKAEKIFNCFTNTMGLYIMY